MDHLRHKPKVCIRGTLSVKTLLDEDLIRNVDVVILWDDDMGYKEVLEFIAELTPKGREFLKNWEASGEALTY